MTASDPADDGYGLDTLPYGIFTTGEEDPRVGVRFHDDVLDLAAAGRVDGHPDAHVFAQPSLNPLMALGPQRWPEIRAWARSLLTDDDHRALVESVTVPVDGIRLYLPFEVADYVDFYASEAHASNVGQIFRPDSPALPPNWKHLPIGYHGRAGTVVVSGTEIAGRVGNAIPAPTDVRSSGRRPGSTSSARSGSWWGPAPASVTRFRWPRPAATCSAWSLLNDWSARDIQAWEYVPLGPFLGKSFATSISAWVLPLEALASAAIPAHSQSPAVLPYLAGGPDDHSGLDLRLTVTVNGHEVSSPRFRDMYWSPSQLVAHLTVNGASLRVGDLFASGTVSGEDPTSLGSLLELSWNGTRPLEVEDGVHRGFLEDGDVVTLSGWAPGPAGRRVALGEVTGRVVAPA